MLYLAAFYSDPNYSRTGKKKVSVLFTHQDGSIDWYPSDLINPRGVLILPEPFPNTPEGEIVWELLLLQ